jgi:hypothetical protein
VTGSPGRIPAGHNLDEPSTDLAEGARQEGVSRQNEEEARRPFDMVHPAAAPGSHERKSPDHHCRHEEGQAEPGRIDREEAGAADDGGIGGGETEDRGEQWPKTRRSAEREGKPHQVGTEQTCRPRRIEAGLAHQHRQTDEAHAAEAGKEDATANANASGVILCQLRIWPSSNCVSRRTRR